MQFEDARKLINDPLIYTGAPGTWADFGSGPGLFTNALASVIAPGSKIYAVDKNVTIFEPDKRFKNVIFEKVNADFTKEMINISKLDGILMANSLHFVSGKTEFIENLRKYFKGEECFLIVEYDTDKSNTWVPYPISYRSLQQLFASLGFKRIHKIHELPSRYNKSQIYSALVQSR